MTITHNFLVGSALNYDKTVFYKALTNGNTYLGFARQSPIWGLCTLVKIQNTNGLTYPTGLIGYDGDLTPQKKYYDLNSETILTSTPVNGRRIYIGHVDNTITNPIISDFVIEDSLNIGELFIDYINNEWIKIEGLDYTYYESLLLSFPPTLNDYYVFNFNQEFTTKLKIDTIQRLLPPKIEQPIRLAYNTTNNTLNPSTAIGSNIVGDLVRSINSLGEIVYEGLNTTFITGNYISVNALTTADFFLLTTDGVVLQNKMKYLETINTANEQSVVFTYPIVGESVVNSGRLKITVTTQSTKLAIFKEVYNANTISNDGEPPSLSLNYLKNGSIHTSIMDPIAIEKIQPSEIWMAKRIDNITTKEKLIIDGLNINNIITYTTLTIQNNTETTVEFALTKDIKLAAKHYFEYVFINKILTPTVPTDKFYRQLFICFDPKNSTDVACINQTYQNTELFNTTKWNYDLGTILYVSNKSPIYRKYIDETEKFQILI